MDLRHEPGGVPMIRVAVCACLVMLALASPVRAQSGADTAVAPPVDSVDTASSPTPAVVAASSPTPSTEHPDAAAHPAPGESSPVEAETVHRPSTGTVHPWGIGLAVDPLSLPDGHTGIPLAGDQSGYHLALGIEVRYQIDDDSAVSVGLGLPASSAGASIWAGYERLAPLYVDGETLRIEFFVTPGLQLGFAGPDYFARQHNVFVGHEYVYSGPAAFALRFPSGIRFSMARSSFDVTASAVPQLVLTPSVELLFTVTIGLLARF